MTIDEEAGYLGRSLKRLAILFVIFLVATFKSCAEIKYKISGESVVADIQETMKSASTRRGPSKTLDVKYVFADQQGNGHMGWATVPLDWEMPEDRKIKVTYLKSNPDTSIATAERSNISFIIFLVLFSVFVVFCIRIWTQVQSDVKTNKKYN